MKKKISAKARTLEPRKCNVVVLGSGGVGKSALTLKLITGRFPTEYDATIEDSYRKQTMIDGEPAMLEILDTAGQEEFKPLLDQWIHYGDGFLLVYAIDERASFDHLITLYEHIKRAKGEDVPIVLCGNKCDMEQDRQVSKEDGESLAQMFHAYFIEASAKQNVNTAECFHEVARRAWNVPREVVVQKRRNRFCSFL